MTATIAWAEMLPYSDSPHCAARRAEALWREGESGKHRRIGRRSRRRLILRLRREHSRSRLRRILFCLCEVLFDARGDPVAVERKGYALEPTESYERNARTAGCEDPRITFVAPIGYYVMTYTAYGPLGPRVALAWSKDLFTWQRIGPAKFAFMPQHWVDFDLYDNKDAYLFPQPVRDPHGRLVLAMIHRPSNTQGGLTVTPAGIAEARPSMWIAYCPLDRAQAGPEGLLLWETHQLLATPAKP